MVDFSIQRNTDSNNDNKDNNDNHENNGINIDYIVNGHVITFEKKP